MKIKLFYGWYIVVAGLILSLINGLVFSYGWTAFLDPIAASFGWSMAQLSLASSLRSLEIGVFNPLWGSLVDRHSVRNLSIFGMVLGAIGIFALSQAKNLAMYYAGFVIVGLGTSLAISVIPVVVIARWFKRDIGKANGLYYTGVGLGGVMVPILVNIIDRVGWQTTLMYAAIIFVVLGIPLSLVYRNRPEEYGLLPDGKLPESIKLVEQEQVVDNGTSVREALRSRPFWYLGIMNLCHSVGNSALMLYSIPYLTGLGVSRTTAGMVVSLYALVSVFMRLPMGTLSDFFRKSHMVVISVTLQTAGMFLFWLLGGTSPLWLIIMFGVVYGAGLGGAAPLRAPILTEYFGRKSFGTIWGLATMFTTIGSVVTQPLAGWVFDTYHDYRVYWLSMVAFNVVVVFLMLTIPRPKSKTVTTATKQMPALR